MQTVIELRREVLDEEKKGLWSSRYLLEYTATRIKAQFMEG